ncbi:hypothetical protein ACFL0L_00085 [Patescibacteria group bacterium]
MAEQQTKCTHQGKETTTIILPNEGFTVPDGTSLLSVPGTCTNCGGIKRVPLNPKHLGQLIGSMVGAAADRGLQFTLPTPDTGKPPSDFTPSVSLVEIPRSGEECG